MASFFQFLTTNKTTGNSFLTGPAASANNHPQVDHHLSNTPLPRRLLGTAKPVRDSVFAPPSIAAPAVITAKSTSTMGTAPTLNVALKNATQSGKVFAYITGHDIHKDNRTFILQADGKTGYWPESPSEILQPLEKNCAIPLGAPGSTTTVTIPQIAGGRVWFSVDAELIFLLNPSPNHAAVVEPSATNPADPNFDIYWSFAEFTYNEHELYANVSYVDFVSLPVSLGVEGTGDGAREVHALPSDGLQIVADKLIEQGKKDGKGWEKLVVTHSGTGKPLRVMSANSGRLLHPGLFAGYYAGYVDEVWEKYRNEDLEIDTQSQWGVVKGRVDGNHNLVFPGLGFFEKPNEIDIFCCSTGPFAPKTGDGNDTQALLNIGARLSAAFTRTTLLDNCKQPHCECADGFYKKEPTNHYARACHETCPNGRGYAFPYDDVGPCDGPDQSGFLRDGYPSVFKVTIGG